MTDMGQRSTQSESGQERAAETPTIQEDTTQSPVTQAPIAQGPAAQQHAAREYRPTSERLVGAFDTWQKAVLALTALVVAAGGLAAAGVKVVQTVTAPAKGSSAAPQLTSAQSQPPQPQLSGNPGVVIPTGPTLPTSAPAANAPTLLGSYSVTLPDQGTLTYSTATGPQTALTYFASGSLVVGDGVSLLALDPPAPTPSTAYQSCTAGGDGTIEIELDDLEPGTTLCAITPDKQVLWITLHPIDPNSQSDALPVTVLDWQSPN